MPQGMWMMGIVFTFPSQKGLLKSFPKHKNNFILFLSPLPVWLKLQLVLLLLSLLCGCLDPMFGLGLYTFVFVPWDTYTLDTGGMTLKTVILNCVILNCYVIMECNFRAQIVSSISPVSNLGTPCPYLQEVQHFPLWVLSLAMSLSYGMPRETLSCTI